MADFNIFQIRSRADPLLQTFFPKFQSSSKHAPSSAPAAWIDDKQVKLLAEEYAIHAANQTASAPVVGMPLNFSSLEDEVGLTLILEALRFGSRYDRLLQDHARRTKSAKDMVQFGLMGAFISSKSLHLANNMLEICNDPHAIGTTFDFPVHKSEALDFAKLGGVYREVNGPLYPLAEHIGRVLNEIGILCRSRGVDSIGHLGLAMAKQAKTLPDFANALAKALPITFGDEGFLCKASRTAVALAVRFPQSFPYDLTATVPAMVDSELVFALRRLGAIKLGPEFVSKVDEKQQVLTVDEANALRSVAKLAVEGLNTKRADLAGDWLIQKAESIEHLTIRTYLCDTTQY